MQAVIQTLTTTPIATSPAAVSGPNPLTLIQQGSIEEGMRLALDEKDIAAMLSALALVSPQQVNSHCSHLTRLCITQQLAADMSTAMPSEGIGKRVEWMKALVLSLLNTEDVQDPNFHRHYKTMIRVVSESIQSAQEMVRLSHYDTGDDAGDEGMVAIPLSVSNDLQLLQVVIQTKI